MAWGVISKPIFDVSITTVERKRAGVRAVFDTGSFYTLIRQDCLPPGSSFQKYKIPEKYRAAAKGSSVVAVGETGLIISIGEKMIKTSALISPNMNSEMIIGAGTMQAWDISIKNKNGKTKILVGHDMRDPEITEIL